MTEVKTNVETFRAMLAVMGASHSGDDRFDWIARQVWDFPERSSRTGHETLGSWLASCGHSVCQPSSANEAAAQLKKDAPLASDPIALRLIRYSLQLRLLDAALAPYVVLLWQDDEQPHYAPWYELRYVERMLPKAPFATKDDSDAVTRQYFKKAKS